MSCVWHPPFGQLIYSGSGIFLFGTYLFGNLSFWFGHLFVWHLPFGQLITLIWASFCWVLPIWQLITLFLAPFLLGSTYLATNYSAFGTFLFFFLATSILASFASLFLASFCLASTFWASNYSVLAPFCWVLPIWHLLVANLASFFLATSILASSHKFFGT